MGRHFLPQLLPPCYSRVAPVLTITVVSHPLQPPRIWTAGSAPIVSVLLCLRNLFTSAFPVG